MEMIKDVDGKRHTIRRGTVTYKDLKEMIKRSVKVEGRMGRVPNALVVKLKFDCLINVFNT